MTYRAGIIGTGGVAGMGFIGTKEEQRGRARSSHAGGYAATDGVELVAIADVDADRLDRFGERWDVPESGRYHGHEAMLEAEALDVVSVCTPTVLHHEHVVDAARIADPEAVWCEKPIASSVSDAGAMVEACDEAGADLVVNHIRRFDPDYRALREALLEDGALGEVRTMNAQFKQELLRNGTHFADMATYLLDARADRVTGFLTGEEEVSGTMDVPIDVEDAGGSGIVQMADGTTVTLDCSVSRDVWTGYLHLTGTGGKLYLNENDGEWRRWRLEEGRHVETDLPGGIEGGSVPDRDRAFANAAANVVGCIEGDAPNRSPGDEATHSLAILIALFVSEYTGGHVDLPLDRPLRDVSVASW